MKPDDETARAVALVERLCRLDAAHAALEDEAEDLRAQLAGRPPRQHAAPGAFEPNPARHPWPRAEGAETLAAYDHRPDDAAIIEAQAGAAFLRRFALLGRAPRLGAAARALAAILPTPRLDTATPDVSIIIPAHGKLGWTLNCLDSLLRHAAATTVEIIVADDASPDATAAVIGALAAARPALRLHAGLGHAGFLRTCNAAATVARGKYLVLLNNDTRVVEGWLDALLSTFALVARAGLVGSKLLYPDGRLQEAGGIVWRDGSAWNYGRDDDPNRPHYCHAREVDYVSGAAIAVPASLWREAGGFDEAYAPAYAEDADLAFRLRAAGHAILFQPGSRVIHYEGKTSGTDPASGAKAHQATNQRRLFRRWHATLATHRRNGEEPYFERERAVSRRALVVDATTPTPSRDAGSVTTTQTLRLFQALGYKPHFVPLDNFLFQPEHTPALLAHGVECAYAPYDTDFTAYLARHGKLFDVVLVYRAPVLARALPDLRRLVPHAPILFHPMDLHFLRQQREAALRGGATDDAEAMRRRELALIGQVDAVITHSTHECRLLAEAVPAIPRTVWPFMFEWQGTAVPFERRHDICFLGGYRHPPNVDAALFLARDVFPRVRAKIPGARLVLAGADPGPELLALAGPDIEVTGHVDDLRPVFDRARVFICPIRYGAGTKGKITVAMAHGVPVVATPSGAEGMELTDGADVLLADDAEALALACARLHADPALWARLSRGGEALVRARHSLAMGRAALRDAIDMALSHRLGFGL